ncbi:hypothetical protein Syun_002230 [Stephania yunnanensis]|uniref:Uncharacterized protein n=1 Tax=Stephania yunnanensis TaxID=152371 RepID=A0AAP0LG50_9MAGN
MARALPRWTGMNGILDSMNAFISLPSWLSSSANLPSLSFPFIHCSCTDNVGPSFVSVYCHEWHYRLVECLATRKFAQWTFES